MEVAVQADDYSSFFEAARTALLQTFSARWRMPVDQITGAELEARLGADGEEIRRLFAMADEAKYSDRQGGGLDLQHWLRLVRSELAGRRD
jgi:hypothetical protein